MKGYDLMLIPSHLIEGGGIPFNKHCREVFETQVAPNIDYNELVQLYRKSWKFRTGHDLAVKDVPEVLPIDVFEAFEYGNKERAEDAFRGFVLRVFDDYLSSYKTRRFIYAENPKGDGCLFSVSHRFSRSYTKKIKNRIDDLASRHKKSSTVLLTLTVDPSKFESQLEMWVCIKSELHRFMEALRLKFKRMKREFPKYLCTIQAQRNGNPHLHIVFLNATRLCDWTELRDLWGLGHIFINRTPDMENSKKVRSPINYVSRYITRTFTKTSEGNVLTQALVWFFGVRSYTCSRGLLLPLHMSCSDFTALCMLIVKDTEMSIETIRERAEHYVERFSLNKSLT